MNKLKGILNRKISAFQFFLVIAVVMITIPLMAARYQWLPVDILAVGKIERLSENDELTLDGASPEVTVVAMDGENSYTIPGPGVYWINDYNADDTTRDSGSGTSILLCKITPELHECVVRLYKMPTPWSGTTDICISTVPWVSGTTDHVWNVTTGVTYESSGHTMPEAVEMDAVGDWLEFTAYYAATGSTWFQTGRYIQ